MQQRIKLDPLAYVLLSAVLGIQVYTSFLRGRSTEEILEESDRQYQKAVFESEDNKGVMHQVFRQNEVDRALLKELLVRCGH